MESIKFKRKPFPVSESVRQKWNHIKTKGPTEQGVDPDRNLDTLLTQPWFSHAKYDKARALVYNNKAYIKIAPTPGIIMLLQIPMILTPLLHTKRSESLPLLFYRYLDTALEVLNWLELDLTDKKTEGYQALQRVRNQHINVTKIMENVPIPEETLKKNPNTVWINQYSMAITEWAFFALFLMYPEKCGFHPKNDQEKEDLLWSLNYLWRMIGFALGMKDEFNIAQEDYKETIEMGHLILEEVYLPAITASHVKENPGYHMGLDVLTVLEDMYPSAIRNFLPPGSLGKLIMNYWYNVIEIPEENKIEMSLLDRFNLMLLSFILNYLVRFKWIAMIMDRMNDAQFKQANKDRKKIYDKFDKMSPEVRYTVEGFNASKCPFSQYLLLSENTVDH